MAGTRKPYIGPSESQSIANAKATDRPHLDAYWRSKDRRRADPPTNVDGLVAWFREQWELEMPDRLHARGVWSDSVTSRERQEGIQPQGGSLLGSPPLSGGMRQRLEGTAYAKDDDGDLIRPLAASLAALRRERRYGHDAVMAVAYSWWDWRSLIGRTFYRTERDGARVLVMKMPEDILEMVLKSSLERLWWLLAEREPHIRSVA